MCGRYVSVASTDTLYDEFDVETVVGDPVGPSWNIAPTDPVRVVMYRKPSPAGSDSPSRQPDAAGSRVDDAAGDTRRVQQLRTVRWGLVPSWSRDARGGARMINARVETVTVKPAFKAAAARRRCLIPALGYYEWQKTSGGKVPYFLHDPDDRPLAMAGLYELWREPRPTGDDPAHWLWTCTIITQQATDALGMIHDRCPVMVPVDLREQWLDCASDDPATARGLLDQLPPARLAPYVVSAAVGNVANNGPELIEPVRSVQLADQVGLPSQLF